MSSHSSLRVRSRRSRTPQVLEPEPHMSLQRPSSAWSQDIAHILDRCFGATFSEQSIEIETIRNFTPGSDVGTYQNRFADRLKNALNQFNTQNDLLDSADRRNSDLHTAFLDLFASEQFESPASSLIIPPKNAPDKSLLDLSLFDQTSLISPDCYYPFVFTRYQPPTRDPGVRPNYENATQNWEEKGQTLPLIKDTTIIRQQPHSNTSRTLKSQVKNRPKTKHETQARKLTPPSPKRAENFISSVNSDNYFISEPSEVIFDAYEPRRTYATQVILRNVSRYMREFRIFTPTTEYFRLSEATADLNIAPGMTSSFSVTFTPDSYGNYSDQIKVTSEDGKSFFIPLIAARPSPVLSLPFTLDCGNSIASVEKRICFSCTNTGGSAFFAFSRENNWFDPSLPNESLGDCLVVDKFVVAPVLFELQTGAKLDINVTFSPDSENEFLEEVFLHCSNKTTISFELLGVAHHPMVELLSRNQKSLVVNPTTVGENGIQITSQIFKCPPVTLGHESNLEITVNNMKPIPLGVKWIVEQEEAQNTFTISPNSTVIGPSENLDFSITFTPAVVDEYFVCLQLFLQTNKTPVIARLYLEAQCQEVCIVPSPPLITSPGLHLIDSVITQSIQLCNHGCSPVQIDWMTEPYGTDIQVSPKECELAPQQSFYFSVQISRSVPGLFEHDLTCKIAENTTLTIPLKCEFRGANISIEQLDLNIGLISFNTNIKRTFSISNGDDTAVSIDIRIRDMSLYPNTQIKVIPKQIEISAFSSHQVDVEISTIDIGDINCIIECVELKANALSLLPITGVVQRPFVITDHSPLISLGDIFVNVPVVTMVTLKNVSQLPAEFNWDTSVNPEFCEEFLFKFSPKNGRIESDCSCEVKVEIICSKVLGIIEELFIVCNIENSNEPVILSISCDVKGMSVTFSHNQQPLFPRPNSISLDFGTVTINNKNQVSLSVNNETTISSPFEFWVDKLSADRSAGETARGLKRPGQEFDVYLGEDILKKRLEFDEQSVWKAYLSAGKGACFLVQTESQTLSPNSSTTVTLTAFSNMWGEYRDKLLCRIEGIEEIFCFEFKIIVVGCPLIFHSIPSGQLPIVRFGSHLFEKTRVTRKIRVNNTSPSDIRVDWNAYTQISDQSDHDVIDIELNYGNPFPSNQYQISYSDKMDLTSDLINLSLRPHDSIQTTNTFSVTPTQSIIPGNGNITFDFTFYPTLESFSQFGENIFGHALAYMSLDFAPDLEGNVTRVQGRNIEPLRVDFNAGIIHPKVEIAPVNSHLEEDVLGFAFPASKLMKINSLGQFQSFKTSYQTFQQITIQNTTKQKLNFDIILPSQLKIVDSTQLPFYDSLNLYTLKQNQLVTLKLSFTLETKQMPSLIQNKQQHWYLQTNKDGHKYLIYKQNLKIQFPSNITQDLPIESRIELPLLKLSTDVINFGSIDIGEVFSQQFCIYNYASKCYAKWSAKILPENSVLSIDNSQGLLPGFTGGFEFSSKTILVSFSPLEEMEYEFEVVITGEFCEVALSVTVSGSGKHKLN